MAGYWTIFLLGFAVGTRAFWNSAENSAVQDVLPQFEPEIADPTFDTGELYKGGSLRDLEHLPHNSLWGHKYIGGGAGEGQQFLSPSGSMANKEQVKTDAVLPAYCDPPNPCPPGFRSDDGCLEEFDNSAEFSRQYQSRQDCLCDEDHMFTCPPNHRKASDTLRDVEEFSQALNALLDKADIKDQHKTLVAKKFHAKRRAKRHATATNNGAHQPGRKPNPYLMGERLHTAAKKG